MLNPHSGRSPFSDLAFSLFLISLTAIPTNSPILTVLSILAMGLKLEMKLLFRMHTFSLPCVCV